MKKFLIEWETDFCDNFPERMGEHVIEAENENEAIRKFNALKIQCFENSKGLHKPSGRGGVT